MGYLNKNSSSSLNHQILEMFEIVYKDKEKGRVAHSNNQGCQKSPVTQK